MTILVASQGKQTFLIPMPWRPLWLALKIAELIGMRSRLRSDGLVGLLNPDCNPDFGATIAAGLKFQEFVGFDTNGIGAATDKSSDDRMVDRSFPRK